MTVAERSELLDAVERLEREVERDYPTGTIGAAQDALIVALADLIARVVRVWLVTA